MNAVPEPGSNFVVPTSIDGVKMLGDPAPNRCPKCQEQMELGELDENLVIVCRACQSLLVQSQVFARIVQNRRRSYNGADVTPNPLDSSQFSRKLKCPGCQQDMCVHAYHGPGNVVVDSCSKCWFTFLDYGELASIEQAPGRRQ